MTQPTQNQPTQNQPEKRPTPMRADARRNRASILEAAETAFAAEGVGVAVDEIASRAGVGTGTLYRHFPTKEALFEAVLIHHIDMLATHGEELAAGEDGDPGEMLFQFMSLLANEGSSKRNLVEALGGPEGDFKQAQASLDAKARVEKVFTRLLERAQAGGSVRPDVTTADLFGLVMGTCMLPAHEAVDCSQRRMLSVVWAGLRSTERLDQAQPS